MGLRKILEKIWQTKPFRAIDREVNARINNKLNKFIQPLNFAVAENGRAIAEASRAVAENSRAIAETSRVVAETNRAVAENGRAIAEIKMVMEATARNQLDRLCEIRGLLATGQAEGVYRALHSCLLPEFVKAFQKIAGDEQQELLRRAHLILLEITKGYLAPGWGWRLEAEISRFNYPADAAREETGCLCPADDPGRERLRILLVSGMFPSVEHGGGLRLFDIISLLAVGHDLDLFSVFNPELDRQSQGLIGGKLKQCHLVSLDDFNPANVLAWLASLGRPPGYYDVIQCEYPQSPKLIDTLRPFGKKIGFTFMECITKSALIKLQNSLGESEFHDLGGLARSFWDIAVTEQAAARDTDFQIAVTSDDAQFIERMSGVRPHVIPTALSPTQVIARLEACGNAAPEGNTVVFLGYFDHFPNIDGVKWYLNKIHPRVKREVAGYRFLVVGTGDTSRLQEISGDDQTVVYTGKVDDIIPHILRGKVCVLPLISGAGIRGKLNQYSIAGRPSVSTGIGNLGLNYPDGEAVLLADDPRDFAAAVVRLLTDDTLNAKIAAKAKAYAEANFTWDSHLDRLVAIYRG